MKIAKEMGFEDENSDGDNPLDENGVPFFEHKINWERARPVTEASLDEIVDAWNLIHA